MTKERLQDLAIGFDEYGFEPNTLCDKEAVIEEYRNAFTEMLKDYERFEKLEEIYSQIVGFKIEYKSKEELLKEVEQTKEQNQKYKKEWEEMNKIFRKHYLEDMARREETIARLEKELEEQSND